VKTETIMLVEKVFHTIVFTYKRSYHAMNFRSCVTRKALNFLTTFGLLICTLIFENQGLEKLRSDSNLRKISVPALLDFFSVCHLDFFSGVLYKFTFFLGGYVPIEKKSRFAGPEIFKV
jgi:hypothetical protein